MRTVKSACRGLGIETVAVIRGGLRFFRHDDDDGFSFSRYEWSLLLTMRSVNSITHLSTRASQFFLHSIYTKVDSLARQKFSWEILALNLTTNSCERNREEDIFRMKG